MKTIILLFVLLFSSVISHSQSEINLTKLEKFASAKSFDEVENDLLALNYYFESSGTTSDGTPRLQYQRINHKSYALDIVSFMKNKTGVGFQQIAFSTYEEKLFNNLKAEHTSTEIIVGSTEVVEDGCLIRVYNSPGYQFQFKVCTEKSKGKTSYIIYVIKL